MGIELRLLWMVPNWKKKGCGENYTLGVEVQSQGNGYNHYLAQSGSEKSYIIGKKSNIMTLIEKTKHVLF